MTEFKIGDRVRHTEYDETGEVTLVLPRCPVQQNDGCLSVRVGNRSRRHWLNRSVRLVTPDHVVPLTPEEEGVRSTIRPTVESDPAGSVRREPELLPAFERAVAERDVKVNDPFERTVHLLFKKATTSLLSKHHDYGPLNIARSPGGPLNGLRVRLWDKLARLNHLVDSGAEPENESLEDTFRDIVGYGAIGLLVLRGDWPDE